MKTEVKTYEEMAEMVRPLLKDRKFVVDVKELPEKAGYVVQWVERKTYIAHDGKEFPDEAWLDVNGEIHLVQDLEPEHARNILRMILRQEREASMAMDVLRARLTELFQVQDPGMDSDEDFPEFQMDETAKPVLH